MRPKELSAKVIKQKHKKIENSIQNIKSKNTIK